MKNVVHRPALVSPLRGEGVMARILLIAAGALLVIGMFLVEEKLESPSGGLSSQFKTSRQIRVAADPSLKNESEVSPYMRSER